jgi:hypothetical protein
MDDAFPRSMCACINKMIFHTPWVQDTHHIHLHVQIRRNIHIYTFTHAHTAHKHTCAHHIQGGVEDGEATDEAAKREAYEEIGLKVPDHIGIICMRACVCVCVCVCLCVCLHTYT